MKKRGKEYKLIISLIFVCVVIFSALFIGKGITGMATVGSNVKPLCTTDSECEGKEVCCIFHEETAGVCNTKDLCQKIDEMTKNTDFYNKNLLPEYEQSKTKESTFFQIFIGMVMLLFAIFLFYIILHEEDEDELPRRKRRTTRKSKKRNKK